MKSFNWLFGAVPALMCSVTLVQAADLVTELPPVYEEEPALFTLTGTAGGVIMKLPTGGGYFEGDGINDDLDLLYGGTLGFSATAGIGGDGDTKYYVGLSAFGTYAAGSFDRTQGFTGPGVVVIQGGGGPNDAFIDIATSGPPATASFGYTYGNVSPEGDILAGGLAGSSVGGAQVLPVVSGSGDSFFWGGAQTDGINGTSAVYAAIADTSGGVFIAAGDLDGLTLHNNYKTEVFYAGADLTVGASGQGAGGVGLSGYLGPSYRYLSQQNSRTDTLTVDVAEIAYPPAFPYFSMQSSEELTSNYLGGVIGGSVSIPLNESSTFTLAGELAGYHTSASMKSDGVYEVWGGGGGVTPPYDLQTVYADSSGDDANAWAYAARLTAIYSVAVNETMQISFAGMADYLSKVAQPGVDVEIDGYDGTNDGEISYESGGDSPAITWGDMLTLSGTVSLTGQF